MVRRGNRSSGAKSHALPTAARQVDMKLTGRQISALSDWVNRPKFHLLKRVSVGMRVVCTSNLNDERGVLNGSTGIVTRLDAAGSGPVNGITVKMDDTGEFYTFKRTKIESHLDSSGISPGWNYRATFPLMPAYAITGHSSQGATLRGRVLIHMLSCFAPGLLYVMLSRVARRFDDDGNPLLRIVGCVIECSSRLRDACFSPPACADGSTATTLCLSISPLKTPSRRPLPIRLVEPLPF
jgi:hypothetical protein